MRQQIDETRPCGKALFFRAGTKTTPRATFRDSWVHFGSQIGHFCMLNELIFAVLVFNDFWLSSGEGSAAVAEAIWA